MKLFKRFSEVGVTVVIASHDVHLIDQVGARRIVLNAGRLPVRSPHEHRAYFSRHAQVLIGSLGRVVHQPFAALMTMGVIAVALALPLFLGLLLQNARSATGNWNEAYDLSVYMDKKAGAARVQSLAKQLRQRGDVATVRIVTAEQALAEFRSDSGFGSALDALADNPLPDTLVVTPTLTASTPQGTESLKGAIAAHGDVQTVRSTRNG